MAREDWSGRLAARLHGAHLLLGLLPALFLVAALLRAAASGFTPGPEDYPRVRYRPGPAADVILSTWRGNGLQPQDRIVAVWGLADYGGGLDEQAPGLGTALGLAAAGARLRLHDPRLLDAARERLRGQAEFYDDPYAAAAGATDLLLDADLADFAAPDLDRLAAAMPGGAVWDCLGRWDPAALRDRGLAAFAIGGPGWPPWLDPEYRAFVAELRTATPADARLLLWPSAPPDPSPRGRWYLLLAYDLAPRAVLLPEAELASGTAVQYRAWVGELGRRARAGTLAAELPAALRASGATHLLRFAARADFRRADWRLEKAPR